MSIMFNELNSMTKSTLHLRSKNNPQTQIYGVKGMFLLFKRPDIFSTDSSDVADGGREEGAVSEHKRGQHCIAHPPLPGHRSHC